MELEEKVINELCQVGRKPTREKILAYEEVAKNYPQIEIPVKHYIHGGMYGREITIPEGTIITGQIYKFDHLDIMVDGDITVSTETGESKRITGYHCFFGESGKKRAGYTHKDTTWITVHPFGESVSNDGEEIQKFITAKSFDELEEFNRLVNINDYRLMVDSMAMSEEEIRQQVENEKDMTVMPFGYGHLTVKPSVIEGNGMFTSMPINKGDAICPARIKGLRTPAGRYINHAYTPNCKILICKDNTAQVYALRKIEADEELTINYRDLIEHRSKAGDLCQE